MNSKTFYLPHPEEEDKFLIVEAESLEEAKRIVCELFELYDYGEDEEENDDDEECK